MGKVLSCGCSSDTNCCCVPRVILSWTGCKDMEDHFDQSTYSLQDMTGSGCAPCDTGCGNTQGWRIVSLGSGGAPGSGGCGEWDYVMKVIETGDIISVSGECYFERCCPSSGNNNFCPSGECEGINDIDFQLQFGCNDVWPDPTNVTKTQWEDDCDTCGGCASGLGGCGSCTDYNLNLNMSSPPADCDCFDDVDLSIEQVSNDCEWGDDTSMGFTGVCFGDYATTIYCDGEDWILDLEANSMCSGACVETWTGTLGPGDCPPTGTFTLTTSGGNCASDEDIIAVLTEI